MGLSSKIVSYSKIFIHMALLLLAAVLLMSVNRQSSQSTASFIFPLTFQGVYSQNGGMWQTLDEHTELNALDGDLRLRGTFYTFDGQPEELSAELPVNFYLDCIMMTITVNGEVISGGYEYSEALVRDMCSKAWVTCYFPDLKAGDEIEISLHNPYRFGNADAYNEFLQMILPGPEKLVRRYLEPKTTPYRVIGFAMLVCAQILLGMAAASVLQRQKSARMLASGGLLVIFAGGFLLFDTVDISLRNQRYVMNSYGRQLCLILFVFELLMLTGQFLRGGMQKAAGMMAAASAAVDGLMLVSALWSGRTLFRMMLPWVIVHLMIFCGMEFLCILGARKSGGERRMMLAGGGVLYAVLLFELMNCYLGLWQQLLLAKIVFILLLLVYLIYEIHRIPQNYFAALREEKLAKELKDSRVKLSLGQIRSHFIYNVLTAINYTGQHDAQKANGAVECFVRYLRSNVDVLQNDKLIPFEQEMAHLRDYIVLEKIHYDEEICFTEQLEVTDFLIPPLVLQPLVENAIHHGFDKMQQKGTISIHAVRNADTVTIVVADDGAGFDQTKPVREGAVGVSNVCFRIQNMIGGTMNMESTPGEGTCVTIQMPYRSN